MTACVCQVKSQFQCQLIFLKRVTVGCIIVLYCFPKDIGSLSIVYLSWADPTASIFGRLFGQYTPQFSNKSLAGSLGAATIGALVTYQFYHHMMTHGYSHPSYTANSSVSLTQLSLFGGFVAAFSEAIGGIVDIDDNLTIPVISGTLLWFALTFLSYGK
jgi:diacylglycerol kinase (CTP)